MSYGPPRNLVVSVFFWEDGISAPVPVLLLQMELLRSNGKYFPLIALCVCLLSSTDSMGSGRIHSSYAECPELIILGIVS